MSKIVRKTIEEVRAQKISAERLAEIASIPDSAIDYSDIPPLTSKLLRNAVRNPFYKPVKKQVTLRIDADVLAWFKHQGKTGYQSRLNAVLRKEMLEELGKTRKRA